MSEVHIFLALAFLSLCQSFWCLCLPPTSFPSEIIGTPARGKVHQHHLVVEVREKKAGREWVGRGGQGLLDARSKGFQMFCYYCRKFDFSSVMFIQTATETKKYGQRWVSQLTCFKYLFISNFFIFHLIKLTLAVPPGDWKEKLKFWNVEVMQT